MYQDSVKFYPKGPSEDLDEQAGRISSWAVFQATEGLGEMDRRLLRLALRLSIIEFITANPEAGSRELVTHIAKFLSAEINQQS